MPPKWVTATVIAWLIVGLAFLALVKGILS
jgi:hypothetical protein